MSWDITKHSINSDLGNPLNRSIPSVIYAQTIVQAINVDSVNWALLLADRQGLVGEVFSSILGISDEVLLSVATFNDLFDSFEACLIVYTDSHLRSIMFSAPPQIRNMVVDRLESYRAIITDIAILNAIQSNVFTLSSRFNTSPNFVPAMCLAAGVDPIDILNGEMLINNLDIMNTIMSNQVLSRVFVTHLEIGGHISFRIPSSINALVAIMSNREGNDEIQRISTPRDIVNNINNINWITAFARVANANLGTATTMNHIVNQLSANEWTSVFSNLNLLRVISRNGAFMMQMSGAALLDRMRLGALGSPLRSSSFTTHIGHDHVIRNDRAFIIEVDTGGANSNIFLTPLSSDSSTFSTGMTTASRRAVARFFNAPLLMRSTASNNVRVQIELIGGL